MTSLSNVAKARFILFTTKIFELRKNSTGNVRDTLTGILLYIFDYQDGVPTEQGSARLWTDAGPGVPGSMTLKPLRAMRQRLIGHAMIITYHEQISTKDEREYVE